MKFALIGPAALEKKIFENGGRRTDDDGRRWTTTDGRRTDDGLWLYYKLTNEPKGSDELISTFFKNAILQKL